MTEKDDIAAGRIVSLYEDNAKLWSQSRSREAGLEAGWLATFEAGIGETATVLDLGCGHGWPIAASLIQSGHELVGIDTSPSLINEAKATLPTGEWHVADMRSYTDNRTFDGVIAWHSFFHLTQSDQRAMFPRFAALTRPGGRLMFTSGGKDAVSIGAWAGEPLYHASLSQDEYGSRLKNSGFEVLDFTSSDQTCGGAAVWLAERI